LSARLSPLGFGVSGPHGTFLVSPRQTRRLIEAAVAAGVTVFDTAPAYGNGEAERRLGRVLAGLDHSRFFVTSKAGLTSFGVAGRRRDFSPGAIEASVRKSLDRLGVEGLDGLFLHGAAPDELTSALFRRLDDLRAAGAFARLGFTGRGRELDGALDTGRFQLFMAPVHPFLGPDDENRLARAKSDGLTVFAIETAGAGPARLRAPRKPADLYTFARAVRNRRAGHGRTGAREGLAAALARVGVDVALFTTTRMKHLQENLEAADLNASVRR